MEEFVFGTLSTQEKRVDTLLRRRSGISHQSRLSPAAPQAGDVVTLSVLANVAQPVERIVCTITTPEHYTIHLKPTTTEWQLIEWRYAQWWRAELPALPDKTLVRYTIEAFLGDGTVLAADDGQPFAYYVGDPNPPAWSRSAIVYQIFPDRFHPGPDKSWPDETDLNAIYGGTLDGILSKLAYIADLGFNAIWLNPFFPDSTHHGYHGTDYFAVNARLGSAETLHKIIKKGHELGIKFILDFVANHWGSDHPTFQDALTNPDSPYKDWYRWKSYPDEYETFFGVQALPQLNVANPEVEQHLLDAVSFWLTEFKFDACRLDYAVGPSKGFWAAFRGAVKQANPEAWIIGEVVEDPISQVGYFGRFDGNLDFLLNQALRRTFATGTMRVSEFDAFLRQHEQAFPANFSRPCFLDNHDQDRFLFMADGDKRKLKLALLCLATLGGPPIIYNGTETGLSQAMRMHDPSSQGMAECRLPMNWADADAELQSWVKTLNHFRQNNPCIWDGVRLTLHVDDDTQTYAYQIANDEQSVMVCLNLSDRQQTIPLKNDLLELAPRSGRFWSK